MEPRRGASKPAIVLSNVDFPAPFGPSMATSDPSGTITSTPCKAGRRPYETWRSLTSSSAGILDLLAQVRRLHGRIAPDLRRRPLRDEAAEIENVQVVAEIHHEAHVV